MQTQVWALAASIGWTVMKPGCRLTLLGTCCAFPNGKERGGYYDR